MADGTNVGTTPRSLPNHSIDETIGIRVRLLRRRRGMKQTELGERLGVSFQQIQKYESGTNRISGSRLVRTAEAFGIRVSALLGEEDTSAELAPLFPHLSVSGAAELIEFYGALGTKDRARLLGIARLLAAT